MVIMNYIDVNFNENIAYNINEMYNKSNKKQRR
jgi:hypothetical protein